MRVLALGCAGGMGSVAVHAAMDYEAVQEFVIADLNEKSAMALAERMGDKAQAVRLDVTDSNALRSAIESTDVVVNSVGPYYRFGVPILKAAIAAKRHYVDICDDWRPTLEMLDLDQQARAAGITAIVGMGASPGISNMLCVKAMNRLDETTELITGWNAASAFQGELEGSADQGDASAAMEHLVHECSGTVGAYRDGTLTMVKPLENLTLDYPGFGRFDVWTIGHPEPVTIPRYWKEILFASNVFYATTETANVLKSAAGQVDNGGKTIHQAAESITSDLASGRVSVAGDLEVPLLFVLAKGKKGNSDKLVALTVSAIPVSSLEGASLMGAVTGIPFAVGLKMLCEGKIASRGVLAPEAAIDPDDFFDELLPYCTYPKPVSREELIVENLEAVSNS